MSYWLDDANLFVQENDLLNEENRSLSGCYTPDEDNSDFIEDVKNSEPPEYVKQLANSGR